MKSRDELADGEEKIETFLTRLAVDQRVGTAIGAVSGSIHSQLRRSEQSVYFSP
jgi:hypothetical protein